MSESLDKFIQLLLQAELITPSQLEAVRKQLGSSAPSTVVDTDLAHCLADSGHLTDFQAGEVRKGNAESLVVDDYLILHPVGKGGMGQVFKARHSVMKREVAVKFLLPDQEGKIDHASAARFQREVEAASKLSHPNIVSSLDAGRRGEVCYLVMEYVRGMNLGNYIRDNGPMSFRQALNCIIQAAQGLEYAHSKGVVHRDIKPSNLLITSDGQVKVLDMGLVRMNSYEDQSPQSQPTEDPLTHSGHLLGTVDFMAPEQAVDPHAADARADIYSLGCTLYFLLTGKLPYRREGTTTAGRIVAHRESPIPSLCQARTDVPANFEPVFQKMMAKQAQKRHQSVMELLFDLRKAQLALQAPTETLAETETLQQPQSTRVKFWLAGTAATIVALLLALGVYQASRPESGSQPPAIASDSKPSPPPEIPAVPSGPVNVLDHIDLAQHVAAGTGWELTGGKLLVPASVPSKLYVPLATPAVVRLKIIVTRVAGTGPLVLGINQEGRSFYLLIDAWRKTTDMRLTALGTKGGKLVATLNNVLNLELQQASELLLVVDANSVSLTSSGDEVLRWQGNLAELSLGGGWGVKGPPGLLIGSNDQGSFEISHLELIPDDSSATPAR